MMPEGLHKAQRDGGRIQAEELERLLLDPKVSSSRIRPYLRIDRVGSLAFRPQVVVDPTTIEGGHEGTLLALSSLERLFDWRRSCRYRDRLRAWSGQRIVAQGDSWVRFPFLVDDLVEHLSRRFAVRCVTGGLSDAFVRHALLEIVAAERPHAVVLSNGADELLAAVIDEGIDADPSTRKGGRSDRLLARMIENHRRLALDLFGLGAGRVICHSYAYPVPTGGRWLGLPLASAGVVGPEAQRRLMQRLIDALHHALDELAHDPELLGRFVLVDCRRIVADDQWWDEIHPTDLGFARLASRLGDAVAGDPDGHSLGGRDDASPGRAEVPSLDAACWNDFPVAQAHGCSEETLLAEIGRRAEAMRLDPGLASACSLPCPAAGEAEAFPGLCRLGAGLVARLEQGVEGLVSEVDEAEGVDRERLLAACGRSGNERVTQLAPALVAGFGIAPSIAPLVAIVLCRRGAAERWVAASWKGRVEADALIARFAHDP